MTIIQLSFLNMNHSGKRDWLQDIDARQRNIVFPDTVRNEGRFWRNLWEGKQPPNLAQLAGVLILLLFWGGFLVTTLWILWPTGNAPWWQKLVNGYGVYIVVVGALLTFIVVGNHRARHKTSKH
jgi:hypothetical protein